MSATSTNFNGRSVLVVEDESMVYFFIEQVLSDIGVVPVRAASVGAALAVLAENKPDLAVVDVSLNGVSSYPIAVRLKELGVPFVFATGRELADIPPEWRRHPMVQKPFSADALEHALSALLEAGTR